MPRMIFLSPDPRPHHPFEAELVIEGLDTEGKPLAVLGDEYLIVSLIEGSIHFERHTLKIEEIEPGKNHRATLKFISRDGYHAQGAFPIAIEKASDPTIRDEAVVHVVTPPSSRVKITLPAKPADKADLPPPLPIIKTGVATPVAGIATIGMTAAPPEDEAIPDEKVITAAPVRVPVATPSKLKHPLVWAGAIAAVFIPLFGLWLHNSRKPVAPTKQTVIHSADAPEAKPETEAQDAPAQQIPTSPPASAQPAPPAEMDEEIVPEPTPAPDQEPPSTPEPAPTPDPTPPPTAPEPAPTSRCGACP